MLAELIQMYMESRIEDGKIKKPNEEDWNESGSNDLYAVKKSFKKSWNLPIESLKWYSQNTRKSNAPQEMYDQLIGAFHN